MTKILTHFKIQIWVKQSNEGVIQMESYRRKGTMVGKYNPSCPHFKEANSAGSSFPFSSLAFREHINTKSANSRKVLRD